MNRNRNGCANTQAQHKLYHNLSRTVLPTSLVCLGLSIAFVPLYSTAAEPDASARKAIYTYDIPAGGMEEALSRFATQAGIRVSFDAEEVKGKTAQALKGSFSVQAGLNQLLAGSGLEAIPQANGYVVKKSTVIAANTGHDTAADRPTTLAPIKVSASTITGPTDGYMATKSFSVTRTDTPLRDVPQSITVVTQDLIKDQTMQNMGDVVRYVPGVGISQGEGNRDAVIFRGNNSTGDFFVDGLRDDVQYFRDLYNIDRVEVLKGSSGMIFGRGGAGGVINRVTKEASWTPVNEVSAQYGSFSHKRVAVDVGRTINEVAAFRLNAMYEHSNSFRNDVELERGGVNPTLTIKPTAQTKIVLSGEYFTDNRTADRGIPSFGTRAGLVGSGRPADIDRSTFFGNAANSPTHTDVWALNSLVQHTFDNNLTFRNRTRYASYDKFYQNIYANGVATAQDATGTVAISAYNNATQRDNIFNQSDFLYNLDTWGVKHEFLAGVEYGRQVTDNLRNTGFFNNTSTSVNVPFFNPLSLTPVTFRPLPFNPVNLTGDANNHGVVEVVGVMYRIRLRFSLSLKRFLAYAMTTSI